MNVRLFTLIPTVPTLVASLSWPRELIPYHRYHIKTGDERGDAGSRLGVGCEKLVWSVASADAMDD